ncbi:hypothetical protein WA026_003877 [Henosepilachna vigintioctopunctata]|uniref:Uncharacterized protein n=1 Tax=Henosepilachna vigintioctopunctata TaxID=420089 RepID=A0AAW1UFY0_9CUCU
MVQISGKYELVRSENFASHLISLGLPEDSAKAAEQLKPIYEIKHDGDNIAIDVTTNGSSRHIDLVLNKEVDEPSAFGTTLKTHSVLDGDTLILNTKLQNGKKETRIHKFSGSEVIVTYQDEDPATPDAIRVFKRL